MRTYLYGAIATLAIHTNAWAASPPEWVFTVEENVCTGRASYDTGESLVITTSGDVEGKTKLTLVAPEEHRNQQRSVLPIVEDYKDGRKSGQYWSETQILTYDRDLGMSDDTAFTTIVDRWVAEGIKGNTIERIILAYTNGPVVYDMRAFDAATYLDCRIVAFSKWLGASGAARTNPIIQQIALNTMMTYRSIREAYPHRFTGSPIKINGTSMSVDDGAFEPDPEAMERAYCDRQPDNAPGCETGE